jgi:hypothetical protein
MPVSHKAKFLPTDTRFNGNFNVPALGGYDFNIPANQDVQVLKLIPDSVYYIDKLSIGANIAREDFLGAISTVPLLTFKHLIGKEIVYSKSLPIVQLYEQKEATVYFKSQKENDWLTLSLTGLLIQTANLVGIDPITLDISLSIYQMYEKDFITWFEKSGQDVLK